MACALLRGNGNFLTGGKVAHMALSVEQFRKILRSDEQRLTQGKAPLGICTCYKCKIPLQEAITGNRQVLVGRKSKNFCSDCYFKQMATEIDEYPIVMPRIRRG